MFRKRSAVQQVYGQGTNKCFFKKTKKTKKSILVTARTISSLPLLKISSYSYCVKHENVMVEKSFISTEWQVCINSSAAKNDPWFAVRHHEMLDSIEQDCYSNYRCNLIIPVIGAYQVICKICCLLSRKNF